MNKEMKYKLIFEVDGEEVVLASGEGFEKLANKMDKAAKQASETKKGFAGMVNILKDVSKNMDLLKASVISLYGKISKLTDYTDKYNTSQQILQNTFRDGADAINEYAENLSYMTGLNLTDVSNQLSKFGQMATSLGMSSKMARTFTRDITDLSAKLSLMYNIDFNQASKALIDAAKGESSTLTSLTGIVLKTQSLQNTLYELGIDREASSLKGAELALAQYITVARQVNATNKQMQDYVNGVAYQKKILTQQIKNVANAFGNLLYPVMRAILPVLNGIMIAIANVVNFFATLVGGTKKTATTTKESIGSIADSYDGLGSAIEGATKKANLGLRSFDKLNNLKTPTSGSGNSGGGVSVDPRLAGLLDETNEKLLNIKNRAQEIAENIMKWLGFTKDVNGEWKFSHVTLGTILGTVGGIGLGILGLKKTGKVIEALGTSFGLIEKGAEGAGTNIINMSKLLEGLKTAGSFLVSPTGLVLTGLAAIVTASVAIEKKIGHTSDIFKGVSKETKNNISGIDTGVKELNTTVNSFSYKGMELGEEEKQQILDKINTLYSEMTTAGDTHFQEQLEILDGYYGAKEMLDSDEYKKEKEQLTIKYQKYLNQAQGYYNEYQTALSEALKGDNKITAEERVKLYEITQKINKLSYENLATTEKDKTQLLKNFSDNATVIANTNALNELKINKQTRDDAVKKAKDKYTETIKWAKKKYGEDTDEYKKAVKEAKKVKDGEIKEADDVYNKYWKEFKKQNSELSKFIDKNTADISEKYKSTFGSVENALIEISAKMDGKFTDALWNAKTGQDLVDKYGDLGTHSANAYARQFSQTLNKNKIKVNVNSNGSVKSSYTPVLGNGKATLRANGGFPEHGEMFIMNETNKPEFLGTIGTKTAVVNDAQIVDGVAKGVTQAILRANSVSLEKKQPIYNKVYIGNEELTNWIDSKNTRRDRQFGY